MHNANKPEAFGLPPEPLVYTVAEACRLSTCCKSHIYNLIRAQRLEAVKVGRRTLIPAASLRALIEGGAA